MHFLDLIEDMAPDWHARAVCHPDNGHDPDIWFPLTPPGHPGASDRPARRVVVAPAVALCNTCPVKRQCLDAARANGETSGVWGGVDFEGKTKPPVSACGTESGYLRHRRAKEDACKPCRDAHSKANRARRAA